MVGLVDDDGIDTVGVVLVEPPHKALHRSADDGFPVCMCGSLLDAAGKAFEVFQRLYHEFFPVR